MKASPTGTTETPLSRLNYRRHLRVFPVSDPATLYVRGSQCRVVVHYHEYDHVEIHASLYAAFGMRLIVEQDDAGVYVVVKRRRILGLLSRSEVQIHVPDYCHLAFNLTPGHVEVQQLNGILEIPPATEKQRPKWLLDSKESEQTALPESSSKHLSAGG